MPSTWLGVSKEVTGAVIPETPINETYVAVKKIQELVDEGKSLQDIALIWNTSLGGSEKPKQIKGKNRLGVLFNSVAYAATVEKNYQQLSN